MNRSKSEYLTMRISLAETAWLEALSRLRLNKQVDRLQQLKEIDLLAWEIEKLKEGRI